MQGGGEPGSLNGAGMDDSRGGEGLGAISREWRHPGLSLLGKITPKETPTTRIIKETAQHTGRARQMHKGQGDRGHDGAQHKPLGTVMD